MTPTACSRSIKASCRRSDQEQRAALDRDLARWFLTLIHRRLRTGKVQADVVQLAARFAETFAATVEGASVRASLPTLRRSVGLCPRCAQPYTGVADACPNCKKGAHACAGDAAARRRRRTKRNNRDRHVRDRSQGADWVR